MKISLLVKTCLGDPVLSYLIIWYMFYIGHERIQIYYSYNCSYYLQFICVIFIVLLAWVLCLRELHIKSILCTHKARAIMMLLLRMHWFLCSQHNLYWKSRKTILQHNLYWTSRKTILELKLLLKASVVQGGGDWTYITNTSSKIEGLIAAAAAAAAAAVQDE